MAQAILTRSGHTILVDEADYPDLARYSWHRASSGYIARTERVNGRKREVLMHRQLMAAPSGVKVDHANRDTLDNRRVNLRLCSQQQNGANRGPNKSLRSPFKGVRLCVGAQRRMTRWSARIKVAGRELYIGSFGTATEAAAAYDRTALFYFGDFACLNLPQVAA